MNEWRGMLLGFLGGLAVAIGLAVAGGAIFSLNALGAFLLGLALGGVLPSLGAIAGMHWADWAAERRAQARRSGSLARYRDGDWNWPR